MLTILLGSDTYSKKKYLEELTKKTNCPAERVAGEVSLGDLTIKASGDLFGGGQMVVAGDTVKALSEATDQQFTSAAESAGQIIFTIDSLDRRKKDHLKLLNNPHIKVVEFKIPEGADLKKWIDHRLKELGGSFDNQAQQFFIERMSGPPSTAQAMRFELSYDLWRIDNELKKLLAFAGTRAITIDAIDALINNNIDTQGWTIINAVADRKTKELFAHMESFFKRADGSDEKAKVIQLNALLADQFRGIMATQSCLAQNLSDSEISSVTGWKSGKVFVMKRLAQRFTAKQIAGTLGKLEHLDREMKTGSVPPRVLLDMIISQI